MCENVVSHCCSYIENETTHLISWGSNLFEWSSTIHIREHSSPAIVSFESVECNHSNQQVVIYVKTCQPRKYPEGWNTNTLSPHLPNYTFQQYLVEILMLHIKFCEVLIHLCAGNREILMKRCSKIPRNENMFSPRSKITMTSRLHQYLLNFKFRENVVESYIAHIYA